MSDVIPTIGEAFKKFEDFNVQPHTFVVRQSIAEFIVQQALYEEWGKKVNVKILPSAYNTDDNVFYLLPEVKE